MINCFSLFLLTLIFSPLHLMAEDKDIKFIHGNDICNITIKDQLEAREYIQPQKDDKLLTLKSALTNFQLKVLTKRDVQEQECALYFFYDKLKVLNKNNEFKYGHYSKTDMLSIARDFATVLEKLTQSENYKAIYERKSKEPSYLSEYYFIYKLFPSLLNSLDPELAKKIYLAIFLSEKTGSIEYEEWEQIFRLFFKEGPPPKELANYISNKLLTTIGNYNYDFLKNYLQLANKSAYDSFFRDFFENINDLRQVSTSLFELDRSPEIFIKIFKSPFFPDSFKCKMANVKLPNLSRNISASSMDDLKKLSHHCLKDFFDMRSKLITPTVGCPFVALKPGEDLRNYIAQMPPDFVTRWISCRRECKEGDTCMMVNKSGELDFINSKFAADAEQLKLLAQRPYFGPGPFTEDLLKYDLNKQGTCRSNICQEDVADCSVNGILNTINEELKSAHFRDCKVDSDCNAIYFTNSCEVTAINKTQWMKLIDQGPMPRIGYPNQRLQSLYRTCNIPYNPFPAKQCRSALGAETVYSSKCLNTFCEVIRP